MIGLFPLIHFNSIHFNSMQCTAEQCSSMPFNSYESCGCHCSLRSYALMILILSLCLCVSASCVADSSAAATLVVCSHRECPAIVSRSLISRRIMLSHIQIATTKTARDMCCGSANRAMPSPTIPWLGECRQTDTKQSLRTFQSLRKSQHASQTIESWRKSPRKQCKHIASCVCTSSKPHA